MKRQKPQQRAGTLGKAVSKEHTLRDAASFEEAETPSAEK